MCARACRTAHAVDVVFGNLWQVVINDVFDVRHIKAARGDVCGDHDAECLAAEFAHDFVTGALTQIAVQGVSLKAIAAEVLRHSVCVMLRFYEDNDGAFALMQLRNEFFVFLVLIDADDILCDVHCDFVCRADGDALRVVQVFT